MNPPVVVDTNILFAVLIPRESDLLLLSSFCILPSL